MEVKFENEVSEDVIDFLQHYGVPRMKWGVRKTRPVSPGSNNKGVSNTELRARNERMRMEIESINLQRNLSTIKNPPNKAIKFISDIGKDSLKQILTRGAVQVGMKAMNSAFDLNSDTKANVTSVVNAAVQDMPKKKNKTPSTPPKANQSRPKSIGPR